MLKLAYQCLEAGGSATCTLNAADEIAVEAFLQGKIGFPVHLRNCFGDVVEDAGAARRRTIAEILEIDRESREVARELVTARAANAVTA